jgi:hypothetical protein
MTDTHVTLTEVFRQATPWAVFNFAMFVVKLTATLTALVGAVVIVGATVRKVTGGTHSGLLAGLGWIALGLGVFGAGYCLLSLYITCANAPRPFILMLPSIIEAGYAFLFGLIVWLIAGVGNAGARRQ